MNDRLQACLAETLKEEGGYSNDAHDPGGPTMHGIIQREYDAYRSHKGLAKRSVRLIAPEEEQEIYRTSYWTPVRADELPPGIDMCVFDFGVNSGPARAIQKMQKVLGLAIDGHLGNATLAAICSADTPTLIERYQAERKAYLKSLKNWRYFGPDWGRRCDHMETIGEHMAMNAGATHPAVAALPTAPDPDPDVQAQLQAKTPRVDPTPIDPRIALGVGGAVAGPLAGAVATPTVPDPSPLANIPAPPDLSAVTAWQGFAQGVHDVSHFLIEFWPFALGAGALFVGLTYGLPALHRRLT